MRALNAKNANRQINAISRFSSFDIHFLILDRSENWMDLTSTVCLHKGHLKFSPFPKPSTMVRTHFSQNWCLQGFNVTLRFNGFNVIQRFVIFSRQTGHSSALDLSSSWIMTSLLMYSRSSIFFEFFQADYFGLRFRNELMVYAFCSNLKQW